LASSAGLALGLALGLAAWISVSLACNRQEQAMHARWSHEIQTSPV
jgi:hypothetical protein